MSLLDSWGAKNQSEMYAICSKNTPYFSLTGISLFPCLCIWHSKDNMHKRVSCFSPIPAFSYAYGYCRHKYDSSIIPKFLLILCDKMLNIRKSATIKNMKAKKNLLVVGDRVLIDHDDRLERTTAGLYLPPTVKERDRVQGGYIVKVGPGYPISDAISSVDEPWSSRKQRDLKFVPLQAQEGDYAIFLKEAAVEIEFDAKKYLIVPHSAILALVRTELADGDEWESH